MIDHNLKEIIIKKAYDIASQPENNRPWLNDNHISDHSILEIYVDMMHDYLIWTASRKINGLSIDRDMEDIVIWLLRILDNEFEDLNIPIELALLVIEMDKIVCPADPSYSYREAYMEAITIVEKSKLIFK